MRIMENCPVEVIEALRAKAVELGLGPMPEHKKLAESLKNYDNPWSQPRRKRDEWMQDLQIKDLSKEKGEVLFFPGCTFSLGTKKMREALRADAKLFKKSDIDFGCFLGGKEICCGSLFLRVGMYDLGKNLIERNAKMIQESGARKVVTPCAGCYKTFKLDYPHFVDLGVEVVFITDFLQELYDEKRIQFKELPRQAVTYHDPCHAARFCGVYDSPRKLLNAIEGIELREMERIKDQTWCCGAGGGVMSAFKPQADFASKERIQEAKATGATTLISACPFCMISLSENMGNAMEYRDIAEIVLKATL
jgi:Fe-S oxidoreductase